MFLFVCNHVLILKYAPIKLTMECETRCRTDRVPVKQNGCVTMLVTIHVFTYLFKLFGSKLNIYICLCRILMLFHKLGFSLSLSRPFVVCVCVCALEVCYLNIHCCCCCWLFPLLHSFQFSIFVCMLLSIQILYDMVSISVVYAKQLIIQFHPEHFRWNCCPALFLSVSLSAATRNRERKNCCQYINGMCEYKYSFITIFRESFFSPICVSVKLTPYYSPSVECKKTFIPHIESLKMKFFPHNFFSRKVGTTESI